MFSIALLIVAAAAVSGSEPVRTEGFADTVRGWFGKAPRRFCNFGKSNYGVIQVVLHKDRVFRVDAYCGTNEDYYYNVNWMNLRESLRDAYVERCENIKLDNDVAASLCAQYVPPMVPGNNVSLSYYPLQPPSPAYPAPVRCTSSADTAGNFAEIYLVNSVVARIDLVCQEQRGPRVYYDSFFFRNNLQGSLASCDQVWQNININGAATYACNEVALALAGRLSSRNIKPNVNNQNRKNMRDQSRSSNYNNQED